jgi:hypothetical protein
MPRSLVEGTFPGGLHIPVGGGGTAACVLDPYFHR